MVIMINELGNLLPGLLQGITRVSISYPADVVKVQMQKNLHSTTIGTVQHVLKTDMRKFYRGSSIAFVTIGIERSLQYYYLEKMNKKMVNPYELVYTHDDERLPPSLSLEYPLSRSFFKMIEILNISQFFEIVGKELFFLVSKK